MKKLISIISSITSDMDVLPTSTELIIMKEHPNVCYFRVAKIDNRERVVDDSHRKYVVDSNNYKKLLDDDKHYSSLSNIDSEKIWETPLVSKCIAEFNKNIDLMIEENNISRDVLLLSLCNIDKTLPPNFCFKQGNFPEIKVSHTQLEYTIEILFRVLNYFGYYSGKSEKAAVSGTHDISHAIYAMKSDVLISTDRRFAKNVRQFINFLE